MSARTAIHSPQECPLPEWGRVGDRWSCPACGYEYVVTDRWAAVGMMWEPTWAIESAQHKSAGQKS